MQIADNSRYVAVSVCLIIVYEVGLRWTSDYQVANGSVLVVTRWRSG